MRSDARAPERGFTLLEIVCTLVILGVLGSLVFSGFGTAITGYTQTVSYTHLTLPTICSV